MLRCMVPLNSQGSDLGRERRRTHTQQFGRAARAINLSAAPLQRFLDAPAFQLDQLFSRKWRIRRRRPLSQNGTCTLPQIEMQRTPERQNQGALDNALQLAD